MAVLTALTGKHLIPMVALYGRLYGISPLG
jgi:hypothetical protein